MATYYASGSADAFLSDRGFDDKWVHKEERKKDIWEEVKTGKKKQMSGAEKRARAAAISQQALKNADAVRVDIDGQALNKLLEKQARKEGMGERGQEPKPAKTGEKPAKKAAAPAPAPAQKKEKVVPFVTSVPLAAKHVRSELSSIMAKHENTYAQMIALGELVHEAFEPHRIDLVWDEHVGLGATPRSWLQRPASLLAKDTVAAIVEWLDQIQASHLAELLEFLVEHAMPGGGKLGRGGDKDYLGLKALLQIMLQRVKGASGSLWHLSGARLGQYFQVAEGRVATRSVPSVMWMVVQLAEQDPLSALNAFFVHLQPVVEAEGAHKGALGVQCVRVLEHLLDKLAGGKAVLGEEEASPLSAQALVRIMKVCFPLPAQTSTESKGKAVAAKSAPPAPMAHKKPAVEELCNVFPRLLAATPITLRQSSCAFANLPIFLPIVSNTTEYSERARGEARGIVVRMLFSDVNAFKVLANTYEAEMPATVQVLHELEPRLVSRAKHVKSGLAQLRTNVDANIAALEAGANEAASAKPAKGAEAQNNVKKAQKRREKLDKYRDVVAALNLAQGKTAGGGGGGVLRLMCWIIFLAIGLGLLVGYMAVQDIKCNEALQPLVLKMQAQGAKFDVEKNKGALLAAAEVCQDRVEKLAQRHWAQGSAAVGVWVQVGKEKMDALVKQYLS